MNKLSKEQFDKLTDLISNAIPESYSKYSTINGPIKKRLKTQLTPLSFKNKELVNFLCEIAKQDPIKVKNIHLVDYKPGELFEEHKDLSALTLVIITKDRFKGGELYIDGVPISDFKSNGNYLIFNGNRYPHGLTEIQEGLRQTISVFFDDKISTI